MKVNKTILSKIIHNLKLGENGNFDFAGYDRKTKSYKYQTEINIGVQMVMFNRSYDEAIDIFNQQVKSTSK